MSHFSDSMKMNKSNTTDIDETAVLKTFSKMPSILDVFEDYEKFISEVKTNWNFENNQFDPENNLEVSRKITNDNLFLRELSYYIYVNAKAIIVW